MTTSFRGAGVTLRGAILLLAASALFAQDEPALQRFFEGKRVRVKIDMPATHEGVDYYFRKDPPLDFRTYSTRIRRYGVSLRTGDEVMITGIKLKNKNIEFQLGGGGYGVWGDDSGSVSTPVVSKSSREKDLERDIRNEKDSNRRSRMQDELDRLRDRRQRDERRERERAQELAVIKKREVDEKRLLAGSRFNLWFPEGYLKERVPSPKEVVTMLSEWVDFGGLR
jgi:hypothetical protein